jgi:hypothetical protein
MESQFESAGSSRRTMKRSIEIKVRLDEGELEKVKKRAATFGKAVSAFLRDAGLEENRKPVKKMERWSNLGVLGNEFIETREMFMKSADNNAEKVSRPEVLILIEKLDKAVEEIKELRKELLREVE